MKLNELANPNPLIENIAPQAEPTQAPSSKNKIWLYSIGIAAGILVIFGIVIPIIFLVKWERLNQPTSMSFVFFNDIHIDTQYNENSLQSDGTFCRTPSNSSTVQRPFGQYGCDIPEKTFDSMIDYLPTVAKPDFILYGGDTVGHRLGLGASGLKEAMSKVVAKFESIYPKVPIFISLGNNDYAVNYGHYSTDHDDFENVASVFGKFMSESELESFKKGGYYYRDFPSISLRLFMINSVLYSKKRTYERADPHDQMKWLREKCEEARNLSYKIGLSMHNPPGVTYPVSLEQSWHTEYIDAFYEIVKAYNIEFSLCSHNHLDLLLPFHNESDHGDSLFYILSSPSLSTAHRNNPGFRVYTLENGIIQNYKQYYANIMFNSQDKLDWKLEYSFNEVYNKENVTNKSINEAVNWIRTTDEGQWRYREFIYTRAYENSAFYYCILKCTTTEQVKECLSGLNKKRRLI